MGVRSSSETSIFDFRDSESDEDKDKPSGQQSLTAMRKDRKPRATTPSRASTPSPRPEGPLHIVEHENVYEVSKWIVCLT
jgi:hypothetical protein